MPIATTAAVSLVSALHKKKETSYIAHDGVWFGTFI